MAPRWEYFEQPAQAQWPTIRAAKLRFDEIRKHLRPGTRSVSPEGRCKQIEIRQPQGSGWVRSDLVDQLVNALRALPLLTGPEVIHPEAVLRRLRLIVSDRLARIRVRHNRHVLVGELKREMDGVSQRVLVLVLANRHIASCDWRLAA